MRMPSRALLVAVVLLSAVPAAARAAAPKVVRVAAPRAVLTGDAVVFRVTVRNPARARSARAVVLLGLAPTADRPGLAMGRVTVPPLKAREARTLRVRLVIPEGAARGSGRASACLGTACVWSAPVAVRGGSSAERIDRTTLPAGTKLRLKLLAIAGDRRLPQRLRGRGSLPTATILAQAAEAYRTGPAELRRAVRPYLLPPRYRGSAWAPARAGARAALPTAATGPRAADEACDNLGTIGLWRSIPAAGGKAVVWYLPDARGRERAAAQRYARELTTTIWPRLTSAFGEPLPDGASGCAAGDARFDVWLGWPNDFTDKAAQGVSVPVGPPDGDCRWPAFVVIQSDVRRSVLAHELFHSIQQAHENVICNGLPPFVEGGADWAMDFVYPRDDYEHESEGFLPNPSSGLVTFDYSAWPFWYWVHREGGPALISAVMGALAAQTLPFALDAALPGGLDGAWKRWALARLNRYPVGAPGFPQQSSFLQWDRFRETGQMPRRDLRLGPRKADVQTRYSLPSLDPLASDAARVDIVDPDLRELTIRNGATGRPGAQLQVALRLADGTWRLEDLSHRAELVLCRERPEEDVRELYLLTGDASPTAELRGVVHTLRGRASCDLHFWYRVTAATATQTAAGTLTTATCTYDVPSSGAWAYAFERTSGVPDGELDLREGVSGSVRASGVSTEPGFTMTITCEGGSSSASRQPIVYTGRRGPLVEFFESPDSTKVRISYDQLAPPAILDIEQVGPDCRPSTFEPGSPWAVDVPIQALASTDPIVLSRTVPWTVDRTFGTDRTTCTGSTSISMTLQRVQEDGSPLP